MTREATAANLRLLVLHDQAATYLPSLQVRFPEIAIEVCGVADEVSDALARIQPQVVLSYKCRGLPGPAHRPIHDCPSVAWVHVGGAGVEHLMPWDPERLTLTNSAGVCSPFMAETVVGAILMLNFGFPVYIRQQQRKLWEQRDWRTITEQTLLVVGLGRIGQAVAAKAKAMGMTVIGIRNDQTPMDMVDELLPPSALHDALARADFVGVHTPLTETTRGLIDAAALAAMQPHAYLINTARGPVVEETALIAALQKNQIAGAYLDVFEQEPLPPDSPLWEMENLVISPHIADAVADWPDRFAAFFSDNLDRWLKGEALVNVVDPARGY